MQKINVFDLQPEMVIAADVISDIGITFLSKGTSLTEAHISNLANMGISFVYIKGHEIVKSDDKMKYDAKIAYDEAIATFKKAYMTSRIGSSIEDQGLDKVIILLAKFFADSTDVLTKLRNMESTELYIYKHAVHVAVLAMTIAKWMRLSHQDVLEVGMAGYLHDVGKSQIPSNILNKPGSLNIGEYDIVKGHSKFTFESVKSLRSVSSKVSESILYHHERLDGTGYPEGLKGAQIPLYARIIAVADVLDAIMSDKVYSLRVSPYKAIEILRAESFGKLDPKITNIVIKNVADCYVGNKVKLSNGQIGEVILLNRSDLTRPLIKLMDSTFVDLSTDFKIEIMEVIVI